MKRCTTCAVEKGLARFHNKKAARDGKAPQCKDCVRITNAKWKLANPDKVKATYNKWRIANLRQLALKKKGYRDASKRHALQLEAARRKRHVAAHPGAAALYGRKWQKENAGHVNSYSAKRKALKLRATPAWANGFFIEEAYDLAQRRSKLTGIIWHVDHIVPLKSKLVCGLHTEHNLQVIPGVANIKKKNSYWPDMPGGM